MPGPAGGRAPSLDKDPRRIAGMFDAIAHRYDQLNHLLSAGLDRRWRRVAVEALELTDGDQVLDVCTGTADLAIAATAGRAPRVRVLGVDFAAEMLLLGLGKLRAAGLDGQIRLARGDAARLPCATEVIDAVTVGFGIRNVQDTAAAITEMSRVLKPGGRLAILEFGEPRMPGMRAFYLWYFRRVLPQIGRWLSRHADAYAYLPASVSAFLTPDQLAALLGQSGFTEIRVDRLSFGGVYLYVARKVAEPPTVD